MSGGSRRSRPCLQGCLVFFAIASALYVSGHALSWRFKEGMRLGDGAPSCGPCTCDCPPPLSLMKIAPGLVNLTVTDCGRNDPDLNSEIEKQIVDLLTEELQLQEAVAAEHAHRMNITFLEARRVASQYQRETEKCNSATETCEEARERAQALLTKESKVTLLWEQRARQLGWEGE